MRYSTIFGAVGLAAALIVALGLASGPARAASTVDVTYDLSDSTLVWDSFENEFPVGDDDFAVNGTVTGSMKVRYASDSSSGMPISHGSATLLTFNVTAKSLSIQHRRRFPSGSTLYIGPYMSGTLHWQLTAPAAGNLTSNGNLTGVNANLLMTGNARCLFTGQFAGSPALTCAYFVGVPTFTIYPSYSRSGPISLAGAVGPYGGAQSTRHTLSGRGRAIGWQPGAGAYLGLGYDKYERTDEGGAFLVGREVLRTDGTNTKVIPEPGTLLLLGAGAAGLGLLGHSRRRARRG